MDNMFQDWKNRFTRFLLWSQKYTKTDMVYLASGGFWLTLGQVVSSLSALALAVAFANFVPSETYGAYKYILSIASIFAIFTLPGMQTTISRAAARGHVGVIYKATEQRILFSFIGSVVALMGSAYYFLNENIELSLAFLVIATTLPIFDTFTGYLAHLAGIRRFDLQTKYHALTQIVSVPTLVVTLFFTENLIYILLAYFLPLVATRALIYWNALRTITKETDASEEKQSITYGKHLTVMNILGVVAGNIDKILLWKFLGPTQLAIYAFALAIPEQLKGPLKGAGELALPKFAAQTPEQVRASLPALFRKLALYALGLLGISVIYILTAPYIFALLFPHYMESVLYSQIFALSLVTGVSSIALAILSAQKKTTVQYVITTIQPLISIALFLLFIPLYGIMGAIIAFVMSRFIATGMYLGSLLTLK